MEYNIKPVCVECGTTSPQFCDDCRPPTPDLNEMLVRLFSERPGAILMANPNGSEEYKIIYALGEFFADTPRAAVEKALKDTTP